MLAIATRGCCNDSSNIFLVLLVDADLIMYFVIAFHNACEPLVSPITIFNFHFFDRLNPSS
jgi:hypothetical protein